MTLVPYLILLVIASALFIDLKRGILVALVARPIIDCFWSGAYEVVGFRPTQLISVLVPTVIFFGILFSKNKRFMNAPLAFLWIVYISYQFINMGLILFTGQGLLAALDFYMRVFNGFIGYFMLQEVFRTKKDLKILLIALLLSGVFPMAQSVYQNILGGTIRTEATIGGLVRTIGFYHDAVTLRVYSFQTLAAILLYWGYFLKKRNVVKQTFLVGLALTVVLTIYKLYSKAGFLILGVWIVTWFISRKKYLVLTLVLISGLAASLVVGVDWFDKIEMVYTKELGAMEGDFRVQQTLAGRWGLWERHLDEWMDLPFYLKLFGGGKGMMGTHNDYLRVLTSTGIFGLIIYLILLSTMTFCILKKWLRDRSPLSTIALMLILMYGVDSIGLDPGAYSSYQWFAWGLMGLGLRGIEEDGTDILAENTDR